MLIPFFAPERGVWFFVHAAKRKSLRTDSCWLSESWHLSRCFRMQPTTRS